MADGGWVDPTIPTTHIPIDPLTILHTTPRCKQEEVLIPVATPAAAATAATPLPPPFVAVDMPPPAKDPSQSRHPPAAAAAGGAGSVILSPSKLGTATAAAAGHTAVPPAAAPDLEAGEAPFRLWYVLCSVVQGTSPTYPTRSRAI